MFFNKNKVFVREQEPVLQLRWCNFRNAVLNCKNEQFCSEELKAYLFCINCLKKDIEEAVQKASNRKVSDLKLRLMDLDTKVSHVMVLMEEIYLEVPKEVKRVERIFYLNSLKAGLA